MAKQHQSIAAQMKTELEEPLAAFAGGMKERRKIVQGTVEKLLKTKIQQTQHVNKVGNYSKNKPCVQSLKSMNICLCSTYTDTRQVRTRVLKDQGLLGPGTHGHGTGGTS